LDDLEEMRRQTDQEDDEDDYDYDGFLSSKSMKDMSGFTLSAWQHEPETTTGNLAMLHFRESLDSVWEQEEHHDDDDGDDHEEAEDDYCRPQRNNNTTGLIGSSSNDDDDDDDEDGNDYSIRCRNAFSSLQVDDDDDDGDEFCPPMNASKNISNNVKEMKGRLDDTNGKQALGRTGIGNGGVVKRVHFAVPARLEDIQEFEKPDMEDYSKLYYMAHEIQIMMDEFKKEDELNRHVVR
jgi:hypothetical protein